MALTADEVSSSRNDEVHEPLSNNNVPVNTEEVEHIDTPLSTKADDEERLFSTSTVVAELQPESSEIVSSNSISSNEIIKENPDNKCQKRLKSRSVSFAPTVQEIEIPSSRHSSFSSSYQPVDFVDVLVESYKLEISNNLFLLDEEKKYVPKTIHARINPNWREHRTRRLMNKLEELSLWDREEELKAAQAQFLREQKLEQIHDRQRNHDLCLQLMRQRHESEMESAVLLDLGASRINDENTSATIARTINLTTPKDNLSYDVPKPPARLKRHIQKQQDQTNMKTPIGRYRQFEAKMDNKLEKVNQKLKPDRQIMRAYNPYCTPVPPTVVPLFSETYLELLTVPDIYSSNKYNSYHYDTASSLNSSSRQVSSPDHEIHLRAHSKRDVRVPLKEQMNDGIKSYDRDYCNDYYNSRLNSNPVKRTTDLVSSTASSLYDCSTVVNIPRESTLIYTHQPISKSVNQRSLNDDLNAITKLSLETSKKILQSIAEPQNGVLTKTRSTPSTMNKRVKFIDEGYYQNGEE